jgi:hypothetical protein
MTDLSDLFPQSFRDDFAERNIQVGSVIRVFVKDTIPPKIKYFIVIGFSDEKVLLGTVFINSAINQNIFNTEYLKGLNIPLDAQVYDFIDHNSFVDCSDIRERSFSEIKRLLSNDPECSKGIISEETMKIISTTLANASTISLSKKRKFGIL